MAALSGYGGPCPPRCKGRHRYFFKVYALDIPELRLFSGASMGEVESALKEHILGESSIMGIFKRT